MAVHGPGLLSWHPQANRWVSPWRFNASCCPVKEPLDKISTCENDVVEIAFFGKNDVVEIAFFGKSCRKKHMP